MDTCCFDDRRIKPNPTRLRHTLGKTEKLWQEAVETIQCVDDHFRGEWKYYGRVSGWIYVIRRDGDIIAYLIPRQNYFLVTFVFREATVSAEALSNLPDTVIAEVQTSPASTGNSRSFFTETKTETNLDVFLSLLKIKLNTIFPAFV